jgi:hypothetical protein
MPDWKQRAAAMAPDIPEEAIARVSPGLEALESAFRPLAAKIPVETEPSYVQLLAREKEA